MNSTPIPGVDTGREGSVAPPTCDFTTGLQRAMLYRGVSWGCWVTLGVKKITFPKSIEINSGVVLEAGNHSETAQKVVWGGVTVGQAAT